MAINRLIYDDIFAFLFVFFFFSFLFFPMKSVLQLLDTSCKNSVCCVRNRPFKCVLLFFQIALIECGSGASLRYVQCKAKNRHCQSAAVCCCCAIFFFCCRLYELTLFNRMRCLFISIVMNCASQSKFDADRSRWRNRKKANQINRQRRRYGGRRT